MKRFSAKERFFYNDMDKVWYANIAFDILANSVLIFALLRIKKDGDDLPELRSKNLFDTTQFRSGPDIHNCFVRYKRVGCAY